MAFARTVLPGTNNNGPYTVGFPYIVKTHVKVYVDGTEDTTFTWENDTQIRTTSSVPSTSTIVILRETSQGTRLVDYVGGTNFTEASLDKDSKQAHYMAQEAYDKLMALIPSQVWDALSKKIINVADPTNPQDAATKAYADALALGAIPGATETTGGLVEIATQAEVNAGTPGSGESKTLVVSPEKLHARVASETLAGLIELATQAETDAGTDDARAITALKLVTHIAALTSFLKRDGSLAMTGALAMGSNKITGLASGTASTDAITKGQLDAAVQGIDWQESVKDKDLFNPPGSPTTGDRYIVAGSGSGGWFGWGGDIAEYDGTDWVRISANEGFAAWVEDEDALYIKNNAGNWVKFGGVIDHGNLVGLGDDDHTQYMQKAQNLNDVNNKATARANLAVPGLADVNSYTGSQTFQGRVLSNQGTENTVNTLSGTSVTWNLDTHPDAQLLLTGATTFNLPSNRRQGRKHMLRVTQAAAGGPHNITWNGIFKWVGGVAPVISTTANAIDVFEFWVDDNLNIFGVQKKDMK